MRSQLKGIGYLELSFNFGGDHFYLAIFSMIFEGQRVPFPRYLKEI
jgi:hypothetical protein